MKKILILCFPILSYGASFENHSTFTAEIKSGWVTAYCVPSDQEYSKQHFCRDIFLKPASFLYFTHEKAPAGTSQAILVANHEKGTEITKKMAFDVKKGRSKYEVNLFADSLLNRALLRSGKNQISYSFTDKSKQVLEKGTFEVNVERLPEISCRHGIIHSSFPNECTNALSVCDKYFEKNYCY